jgi:inhibitor of cysteine peptidase
MPNVATVENVVVNTQSTTPNEVEVIVKGYLPNPCTKITRIEQQRNADTFTVTLETVREGSNCIEVISPFEETVALDTTGLAPGTYTVNVQNTTTTFDLK